MSSRILGPGWEGAVASSTRRADANNDAAFPVCMLGPFVWFSVFMFVYPSMGA